MTNSVFVNTQGLYQRRRAFNLSYRNDYNCNIGEVVPVYFQDLIPNTSISINTHGLIRFLPMIAPIMDNIDYYVHFWQAPRRILEGDDFTKMITGEHDVEDWPGVFWKPENIYAYLADEDVSNINKVYIVGNGSIFDLFGYDLSLFGYDATTDEFSPSEGKLNARKFIIYFRLLSNWYTNENVEPYEGFFEDVEIFDKLNYLATYNDGDISEAICKILLGFYNEYGTAGFAPHLWPKDYYTSGLPTLQYGTPTYLPLGDSAPVQFQEKVALQSDATNKGLEIVTSDGTQWMIGGNVITNMTTGKTLVVDNGDSQSPQQIALHEILGKLVGSDATKPVATVDLSDATAITVNELRAANALQVFKEREMRYGRKAPEYYKGFYGVQPGDLRLQLPKFLGGGKMPVVISDIEQTSASQSGSPQGNLAGKGSGLAGGFARAHTFTAEEAVVIGVAWLMPKVTYSRTLSRHDTKLNDRFQYYNPSFAHIGEQEVFNYEVFAGSYGTDTGNEEFAYQPRYTEYRFHANEMHGDFKGSLSYWTLGRIFSDQPALNKEFVYIQPRAMQRIFALQFSATTDEMIRNVLVSLQFNVAALQPLSRYGTPGLLV